MSYKIKIKKNFSKSQKFGKIEEEMGVLQEMRMAVVLVDWLEQYVELSRGKRDVLLYGMNILLTAILGYVCIIGLSLVLNTHYIVIPMLVAHSILRTFTGGAHGSKVQYCVSLGVIVFNLLGLILKHVLTLSVLSSKGVLIFSLIIFLMGLYYITMKVPVDVKEKPIISEVHRQKLKKYSYAVLLVWYGMVFCLLILWGTKYQEFVMAISMGMLWQIMTLSEFMGKIVAAYGKLLNKLGI